MSKKTRASTNFCGDEAGLVKPDSVFHEKYATLAGSLLIKEARSQAGLTQTELAERLGISQPRIAELENAPMVRGLALSTILRVADACGFRVELKLVRRQTIA